MILLCHLIPKNILSKYDVIEKGLGTCNFNIVFFLVNPIRPYLHMAQFN